MNQLRHRPCHELGADEFPLKIAVEIRLELLIYQLPSGYLT
jgi:hypothetical protein